MFSKNQAVKVENIFVKKNLGKKVYFIGSYQLESFLKNVFSELDFIDKHESVEKLKNFIQKYLPYFALNESDAIKILLRKKNYCIRSSEVVEKTLKKGTRITSNFIDTYNGGIYLLEPTGKELLKCYREQLLIIVNKINKFGSFYHSSSFDDFQQKLHKRINYYSKKLFW